MWDDSSEGSQSPPADRNKKAPSRLISIDSKYTGKPSKVNKSGHSSWGEGLDKDILFSPEESLNSINFSPDNNAQQRFSPTNVNNGSPSDNYLSNFATTSGDLDDSILGGLLGGASKKVKPPTEPISSVNKSARYNTQLKLDPLNTNLDDSPKTSYSPRSIINVKETRTRLSSVPLVKSTISPKMNSNNNGNSNFHSESFDDLEDYADKKSPSIPYIPSITRKSTTSTNNHPIDVSDSDNSEKDKKSKKKSDSGMKSDQEIKEKDTDGNVGLGFMPSFLEPGRQPRRRRQLDSPSSSLTKLDDLDAALGLQPVEKKVVVDPFSKVVDQKLASLATSKDLQASKGKGPVLLADSSDESSTEEDLYKRRYQKKDSFSVKTSSIVKIDDKKTNNEEKVSVNMRNNDSISDNKSYTSTKPGLSIVSSLPAMSPSSSLPSLGGGKSGKLTDFILDLDKIVRSINIYIYNSYSSKGKYGRVCR